ncbi:MAG: carboxypeptidase-like regulatory domain-containing protein [Planctomycetes bacterium]|nr:carboxypeptidase-like regulatory domain-containing protein [Planctomycetota bacterium]
MRRDAGVADASVLVIPTRRPEDSGDPHHEWPSGKTLPDGSFRLEHVPPGPAILQVDAPPRGEVRNSAQRRLAIEVPDRSEHEVDVLLSGATISGRVVRALDGSPIGGLPVGIVSATFPLSPRFDGTRMEGASTDEEGRYRVTDLEPGPYLVVAGFGWEREDAEEDSALASETRGAFEVAEGGETRVDFALSRGGTAVVRVSDPEGKAVKEAELIVVSSTGTTGLPRLLAGAFGTTDEKGIARVAGLRPGRYYATVPDIEFAGAESDEADVRRDAETAFPIELRRGTRVRVRVLDEAGALVDFVSLWTDSRGRERFAFPAGLWRGTVRKGEAGMGIAVLLPGEYTVRVGGGGWKEQPTTVQVGTDSPQDVVLRLERDNAPR